MTHKHTPGPWSRGRVLNTSQTARWTQQARDEVGAIEATQVFSSFTQLDEGRGRGLVCTVNEHHPQYEANANLIAAAPETAAERDKLKEVNSELLEALEILKRKYSDNNMEGGEAWFVVTNAIAKARG